MKIARLLLLMMVASFAIVGCDTNDGAAEDLGEAMDDAMDDAGDKIEEAATDAGNAIEDACEDVKEGVNADDTDC